MQSCTLQASVRCLGNWGKLLEIGKYDILQGTPLSMRPMLNNISFEGIDVDRVMNHPESTEVDLQLATRMSAFDIQARFSILSYLIYLIWHQAWVSLKVSHT